MLKRLAYSLGNSAVVKSDHPGEAFAFPLGSIVQEFGSLRFCDREPREPNTSYRNSLIVLPQYLHRKIGSTTGHLLGSILAVPQYYGRSTSSSRAEPRRSALGTPWLIQKKIKRFRPIATLPELFTFSSCANDQANSAIRSSGNDQ
jgi:hypothetical protein